MMKDIKIYVSKETRKVDIERSVIGNDAENLQGNLVFSFCDDFVNGIARIEYTINGESHYQMLEKQDEEYIIPIKSVLTKKGQIDMQLVITEQGEYQLTSDTKYKANKFHFVKEGNEYTQLTEGTDYEIDDDITGEVYEMVNIPIFKSNIFYLVVNKSINAEGGESPEEYASWLEIANQKLIEIDNLDLDVERAEDGVIVVITKKDGSVKYAEVYDGQGGSGGTSNYEELENKPQINNVELIGNNTLDELGIDQDFVKDESYVHTDNNFTNAYKSQIDANKNDISSIEIEISGLSSSKVDKTTKINNKQLTSDITLSPSDIGIGNVFTLKGSVATVLDLPNIGNNIGDVYYVESEEVGYIWLEKMAILQWEQLGLPIDLSNYVTKQEISTIQTTGESGIFTTQQLNLILSNDKNIAIINDGNIYYLYNMTSDLTYRTYIHINSISITEIKYMALYVNIDDEAVNYGSWTIEEINPLSNYATKTYVDNKIGDIDTALQTINNGGGVE